jgi:hypothetical protein
MIETIQDDLMIVAVSMTVTLGLVFNSQKVK